MTTRTLHLVDWDPAWPARFAAEAARIAGALGERALAVEHVGSTAVPGLAGKPVPDVAVAVAGLADADACIAPLEALGCAHRGSHGDDPRRRYYVRDDDAGRRAAQLHLYILPAAAWDGLLAFRDARLPPRGPRDKLPAHPRPRRPVSEYLEQDLMNERGYVARPGRPRPTQAAVALLGAPDGRVVFGDPKTARATYARAGSRLIHYDDEAERQRRLVCDTALGQLMLDNPRFAKPAVDSVSAGIELYWRGLKGRLALQPASSGSPFKKIVETDGKYVSNPTSFGRLPVKEPPKSEVDQFKAKIDIWLATLQGSDLPQIMTLHDTFLKIHCSNEPDAPKPMELAAQLGLREEWYDKTERGRLNRDRDKYTASMLPGLITDDFTIPFGDSLQRAGVDPDTMRVEKRNRGTDMFAIQASVMRPAFREMLGLHNLVFAASASGTTSTLLASANVFRPGILKNAESLKQYLMACVAYLVGGGMHTCHEVFYTGGLAGLKYTTGKYLDMLPATFTGSRLYERWSNEYWDIVRPDRPTPR